MAQSANSARNVFPALALGPIPLIEALLQNPVSSSLRAAAKLKADYEEPDYGRDGPSLPHGAE
jgi:hypothetical protein